MITILPECFLPVFADISPCGSVKTGCQIDWFDYKGSQPSQIVPVIIVFVVVSRPRYKSDSRVRGRERGRIGFGLIPALNLWNPNFPTSEPCLPSDMSRRSSKSEVGSLKGEGGNLWNLLFKFYINNSGTHRIWGFKGWVRPKLAKNSVILINLIGDRIYSPLFATIHNSFCYTTFLKPHILVPHFFLTYKPASAIFLLRKSNVLSLISISSYLWFVSIRIDRKALKKYQFSIRF